MKPSDLKRKHEINNPDSFFFSRDNMKFAGDTMSNFGVRAKPVVIKTYTGDIYTCWVLYRRHSTSKGFFGEFYFEVNNFKVIHGDRHE